MTDDVDAWAGARLREFDLGPLPDLDLDALMQRGHRQRRIMLADRLLAGAAIVLLVLGAGFWVTRLAVTSDQDVIAPTPTPTATAPTTAPNLTGTPMVEFQSAGVGGQVGIGFAANGTGRSIWVAAASSAGQPGHLYAADPERPELTAVAEIGTYANSLAVTPTREWVANVGGDPRGTPTRPDTVDEFDVAGNLLHAYPVPQVWSVTAAGDTAWALTSGDTSAVYRLAGGRATRLTDLGHAMVAGTGVGHLAVRGDGRVLALTQDPSTGRFQYWVLDPETGAHGPPTMLPFTSGPTGLAVNGSRVLVSGVQATAGSTILLAIDAAGSHEIANCGTWPVGLAATADGAWLTASDARDVSAGLSVVPVGTSSCGPGLRVDGDQGGTPVSAGWATGVLLLTTQRLSGIAVGDPSPTPTGTARGSATTSTLVPADSDLPAAGICLPESGATVTVTANSDTPAPRCATITPTQHLTVVNPAGPGASAITVAFADFPPRTVSPGSSTTFDATFGTYLARGVHVVHISTYGGGGPELWLK